jgi:hypothetical protein
VQIAWSNSSSRAGRQVTRGIHETLQGTAAAPKAVAPQADVRPIKRR